MKWLRNSLPHGEIPTDPCHWRIFIKHVTHLSNRKNVHKQMFRFLFYFGNDFIERSLKYLFSVRKKKKIPLFWFLETKLLIRGWTSELMFIFILVRIFHKHVLKEWKRFIVGLLHWLGSSVTRNRLFNSISLLLQRQRLNYHSNSVFFGIFVVQTLILNLNRGWYLFLNHLVNVVS